MPVIINGEADPAVAGAGRWRVTVADLTGVELAPRVGGKKLTGGQGRANVIYEGSSRKLVGQRVQDLERVLVRLEGLVGPAPG
jgi:hypothetical protein